MLSQVSQSFNVAMCQTVWWSCSMSARLWIVSHIRASGHCVPCQPLCRWDLCQAICLWYVRPFADGGPCQPICWWCPMLGRILSFPFPLSFLAFWWATAPPSFVYCKSVRLLRFEQSKWRQNCNFSQERMKQRQKTTMSVRKYRRTTESRSSGEPWSLWQTL